MAGKTEGRTEDRDRERDPDQTPAADRDRVTISGPGASDFLTAQGGLDTPESGAKGMAQTRDEGPLSDRRRLIPQLDEEEQSKSGE